MRWKIVLKGSPPNEWEPHMSPLDAKSPPAARAALREAAGLKERGIGAPPAFRGEIRGGGLAADHPVALQQHAGAGVGPLGLAGRHDQGADR